MHIPFSASSLWRGDFQLIAYMYWFQNIITLIITTEPDMRETSYILSVPINASSLLSVAFDS